MVNIVMKIIWAIDITISIHIIVIMGGIAVVVMVIVVIVVAAFGVSTARVGKSGYTERKNEYHAQEQQK